MRNSNCPSPADQTPPVRTKACAYLRSATNDDISIEVQRERMLSLAERECYEIIQWYVDVSADSEPVKRTQWLKLLAQASTAEWTVILCLNRTRFSRLNGPDNGVDTHTLQQAGKKLHTAIEGQVGWDATACEIIDQMIDNEG